MTWAVVSTDVLSASYTPDTRSLTVGHDLPASQSVLPRNQQIHTDDILSGNLLRMLSAKHHVNLHEHHQGNLDH